MHVTNWSLKYVTADYIETYNVFLMAHLFISFRIHQYSPKILKLLPFAFFFAVLQKCF